MTVAAILTAVSLNVYSVIHQGTLKTVYHYGQFVGEMVDELRCRTRFVRGLPPCDGVPCEGSFPAPNAGFRALGIGSLSTALVGDFPPVTFCSCPVADYAAELGFPLGYVCYRVPASGFLV